MLTRLLVPIDGSPLSEQALGTAAAIARAAHARMQLLFVHVPALGESALDSGRPARARPIKESYLRQLAAEIESGTGVGTDALVVAGAADAEICRHAESDHADLVVMTSHGRTGFSRLWMGSVAAAVVHRSRVPVMVLRPTGSAGARDMVPSTFDRLLVPLDESDASEAVLPIAADLARSIGASIVLLHVVVPPAALIADYSIASVAPVYYPDLPSAEQLATGATRRLDTLRRRLAADTGRVVEARVVIADRVVPAIEAAARDMRADLIAMSTQSHGVERLVLGSVADKVLRGAELPTLFVRPVAVAAGATPAESPAAAHR